MTGIEIQNLIAKVQVEKCCNPVCCNLTFSTFSEMDVMSMSKAGYITEFEVKISRADFLKDFEKKSKHSAFELGEISQKNLPNYFYYVCPEGLIKAPELPGYAGLIYVLSGGNIKQPFANEIVKAPLIHKVKVDQLALFEKVCRVHTERIFLGGCKLTVKNNSIKTNRKINLQSLGFDETQIAQALKHKNYSL